MVLIDATPLAQAESAGEIWRLKTVEQKTGISKSEIYRLIKLGEFPKNFTYCGSKSGWSGTEVQRWIDAILEVKAA